MLIRSFKIFRNVLPVAGIGNTVVIKDVVLAFIDFGLGEKSGIKKGTSH